MNWVFQIVQICIPVDVCIPLSQDLLDNVLLGLVQGIESKENMSFIPTFF